MIPVYANDFNITRHALCIQSAGGAYCFLRVCQRSSRMNMQMMHQPVGGWIISARADTQSAAPADKGEQQQQNSSAGSALAN